MRRAGVVRSLLTCLLLGLGCLHERKPDPVEPTRTSDKPSAVGRTLAFTLPEHPSRTPHDFATDRGHVLLLDVWATWCEPCQDALPIYRDLQKQYGARGLIVYAINTDVDSSAVTPFLTKAKVQLRVLLDPDGNAAEQRLGVSVMPTTFLVDKRGAIRFVHQGFDEQRTPEVEAEIEALLSEPRQTK